MTIKAHSRISIQTEDKMPMPRASQIKQKCKNMSKVRVKSDFQELSYSTEGWCTIREFQGWVCSQVVRRHINVSLYTLPLFGLSQTRTWTGIREIIFNDTNEGWSSLSCYKSHNSHKAQHPPPCLVHTGLVVWPWRATPQVQSSSKLEINLPYPTAFFSFHIIKD